MVVGEGDDLDAVVAETTAGRGCDAVIECTGLVETWEKAPSLARRGGSVVLFGGCARGTMASLDTYRLHYDGVEVSSPFHFRPRDVCEARRLLCDTSVDWSGLVSGAATLAELPELFANLGDDGEMKVAVYPHGKCL